MLPREADLVAVPALEEDELRTGVELLDVGRVVDPLRVDERLPPE